MSPGLSCWLESLLLAKQVRAKRGNRDRVVGLLQAGLTCADGHHGAAGGSEQCWGAQPSWAPCGCARLSGCKEGISLSQLYQARARGHVAVPSSITTPATLPVSLLPAQCRG